MSDEDLVRRLREGWWSDELQHRRIKNEAAAVIERLTRERDEARHHAEARITALRETESDLRAAERKVEKLHEALKPFAAHNRWSEDWHDGSDCEINVQLRDIRLAASLVDGYDWKPDAD